MKQTLNGLDLIVKSECEQIVKGDGKSILFIRTDNETDCICGVMAGNRGQILKSILHMMDEDKDFAEMVKKAAVKHVIEKVMKITDEQLIAIYSLARDNFINDSAGQLNSQQFVVKAYLKAASAVLKIDIEFPERYAIEPVE